MSEALSEIRDKYFESLVGRIALQRILIFFLFLLALVAPRSDLEHGFLLSLAAIRLDHLISSEEGILVSSRLGDIVIALLASAATAYVMHRLRMVSFRWFVKIRDPNVYMRRLSGKARDVLPPSDSSKETRFQTSVEKREVELRRRAAVAEIFLGLAFLPWVFLTYANAFDLAAGLVALAGSFFMLWDSYRFYISQVLPALAMDSRLSGQPLSFGDGLVDEERVLFGRLEQKKRSAGR